MPLSVADALPAAPLEAGMDMEAVSVAIAEDDGAAELIIPVAVAEAEPEPEAIPVAEDIPVAVALPLPLEPEPAWSWKFITPWLSESWMGCARLEAVPASAEGTLEVRSLEKVAVASRCELSWLSEETLVLLLRTSWKRRDIQTRPPAPAETMACFLEINASIVELTCLPRAWIGVASARASSCES